MWRGLDLPAWEAPYVLRDARLGYLNGYQRAVVSGGLSEEQLGRAAEARWGGRWRERLGAARERSGSHGVVPGADEDKSLKLAPIDE